MFPCYKAQIHQSGLDSFSPVAQACAEQTQSDQQDAVWRCVLIPGAVHQGFFLGARTNSFHTTT